MGCPVDFPATDSNAVSTLSDLCFFRTRETIESTACYPVHHRTVRRRDKYFRVYAGAENYGIHTGDTCLNAVDTECTAERERRLCASVCVRSGTRLGETTTASGYRERYTVTCKRFTVFVLDFKRRTEFASALPGVPVWLSPETFSSASAGSPA